MSLILNNLETHTVATILSNWFSKNQRDLPWRETNDPYKIWLSEIILQQTRVAQGTPYYNAFTSRFPTIKNLADATQDEILKLWQGLGYYSRARNLHAASKQVMTEFNGVFPKSYNDIIKLKGVGPYTAAAIASIAYGEETAVVDGNVIRVISRVFGISDDPNLTITKKHIQHISDDLIKGRKPSEHNQAIMEFGAIQCIPKNPGCDVCPLSQRCFALKTNQVERLPYKVKKLKRRSRYFHFLIISDGQNTLLEKRGEQGIWAGLYQFPLLETETEKANPKLIERSPFIMDNYFLEKSITMKKHVLTHQDIYATFHHFRTDQLSDNNFQRVKLDEVHTFALPRLIDRYLESNRI